MSQTYNILVTTDRKFLIYAFVLFHNILARLQPNHDSDKSPNAQNKNAQELNDQIVFHVFIDESIPASEFEAKANLFKQFH